MAYKVTINSAVLVSVAILTLGVLHQSVQYIANSWVLAPGQLLDWRFAREFSTIRVHDWPALVTPKAWVSIQFSKICLAVCWLLASLLGSEFSACLAFAILAILAIERVRIPLGDCGAEQQLIIVLTAVALLQASSRFHYVAIAFLAAQLNLCYVASGIAKLLGRSWRNGTAVALALQTRSYGMLAVSKFLSSNRALGLVACWFVIIWETAFPVTMFMQPGLTLYAYLLLGVLLHLGIAVFMGLGNFLLAYTAAYPLYVIAISQGILRITMP